MSSTDTSSTLSSIGNGLTMIFGQPLLWLVIAIGLFVASTATLSAYVGSKDSWNQLKSHVKNTLTMSIIGSFVLFIGLLLYSLQDQSKTMYIVLLLGCISLALGYASLTISAVSRL
jgi:hydrogenase/urease accessory protein HupE